MSESILIAIIPALALLLAAVLLVRRIRRVIGEEKQNLQERQTVTAALLLEDGIQAIAGQPLPKDVPDLPPFTHGNQSATCIAGVAGDSILWVFEHEMYPDRLPSGLNVDSSRKSSSTSDSYTCRHTIAVVRRKNLALPEFEIVPNQSGLFGELMERQGVDKDSFAGKLAMAAISMAKSVADPRTPTPLALGDAFAESYNVFAPNREAVEGILTQAVADWLLEEPGLIVSAKNQWVLLTRNVRLMEHGVPAGTDHGILPADDAADLAELALELAEMLG